MMKDVGLICGLLTLWVSCTGSSYAGNGALADFFEPETPDIIKNTILNYLGADSPNENAIAQVKSVLKEYQNIFLIDWDDTLLPGKGIKRIVTNGHLEVLVLDSEKKEMEALEKQIKILFDTLLGQGIINVVTNGEAGWVEISSQGAFPSIAPYLTRDRVRSARTLYEGLHPSSPVSWKQNTFRDILREQCDGRPVNIFSFGDSQVEREAIRTLTKDWPNVFTKSVKFSEKPTVEQLRRELELVISCLDFLIKHPGDLDLQLTITGNPAPPTATAPTLPSP